MIKKMKIYRGGAEKAPKKKSMFRKALDAFKIDKGKRTAKVAPANGPEKKKAGDSSVGGPKGPVKKKSVKEKTGAVVAPTKAAPTPVAVTEAVKTTEVTTPKGAPLPAAGESPKPVKVTVAPAVVKEEGVKVDLAVKDLGGPEKTPGGDAVKTEEVKIPGAGDAAPHEKPVGDVAVPHEKPVVAGDAAPHEKPVGAGDAAPKIGPDGAPIKETGPDGAPKTGADVAAPKIGPDGAPIKETGPDGAPKTGADVAAPKIVGVTAPATATEGPKRALINTRGAAAPKTGTAGANEAKAAAASAAVTSTPKGPGPGVDMSKAAVVTASPAAAVQDIKTVQSVEASLPKGLAPGGVALGGITSMAPKGTGPESIIASMAPKGTGPGSIIPSMAPKGTGPDQIASMVPKEVGDALKGALPPGAVEALKGALPPGGVEALKGALPPGGLPAALSAEPKERSTTASAEPKERSSAPASKESATATAAAASTSSPAASSESPKKPKKKPSEITQEKKEKKEKKEEKRQDAQAKRMAVIKIEEEKYQKETAAVPTTKWQSFKRGVKTGLHYTKQAARSAKTYYHAKSNERKHIKKVAKTALKSKGVLSEANQQKAIMEAPKSLKNTGFKALSMTEDSMKIDKQVKADQQAAEKQVKKEKKQEAKEAKKGEATISGDGKGKAGDVAAGDGQGKNAVSAPVVSTAPTKAEAKKLQKAEEAKLLTNKQMKATKTIEKGAATLIASIDVKLLNPKISAKTRSELLATREKQVGIRTEAAAKITTSAEKRITINTAKSGMIGKSKKKQDKYAKRLANAEEAKKEVSAPIKEAAGPVAAPLSDSAMKKLTSQKTKKNGELSKKDDAMTNLKAALVVAETKGKSKKAARIQALIATKQTEINSVKKEMNGITGKIGESQLSSQIISEAKMGLAESKKALYTHTGKSKKVAEAQRKSNKHTKAYTNSGGIIKPVAPVATVTTNSSIKSIAGTTTTSSSSTNGPRKTLANSTTTSSSTNVATNKSKKNVASGVGTTPLAFVPGQTIASPVGATGQTQKGTSGSASSSTSGSASSSTSSSTSSSASSSGSGSGGKSATTKALNVLNNVGTGVKVVGLASVGSSLALGNKSVLKPELTFTTPGEQLKPIAELGKKVGSSIASGAKSVVSGIGSVFSKILPF